MAIKLADTLAPMADFPAALAEHVEFSDGKSLQEKYDLGELGGEGGGGHIELTQAEYDALTDEEKLNGAIYFITDATGGGGDDSSHVELTQAEYDALSDEEKDSDTIYFITDAEGGSSGIIDDKIDTSSTNPVQNKVLAQEIARAETGKQYLKITGPMPIGIGYLYARTIRDAIENGSALNYQGVDIETVETNIKDNFYNILYRYDNAGDRKYTATNELSLSIVPQDGCIIFETDDVPSGIDKYEIILEWSEPPFVKVYSSTKEFAPDIEYDDSYNFYDLTDLEDSLTSIFNDMEIKSELNIKNHNFRFDLNQDGDNETLKANSYKLQKDFAGNGILTVELDDGRILTSTRTKGYNASWSNWSIKESEKIPKVYTFLAELGLTAPVSVGEIFNAMPDKTMAVIACEGREGNTEGAVVHVSDVPISYGVLTIRKNEKGRFSIEYQNSLQGSPCNVKRWIGTLKGSDGTGLYWKQLSAEPTFVSLNDIGLTADATFQDVVDTLPKGGSALLGVTEFTNYQTIFPYEEGNDQFARVHIVKGTADGSRMYARWFRKDGVKEALAKFSINTNKFDGWQEMVTKDYVNSKIADLQAQINALKS